MDGAAAFYGTVIRFGTGPTPNGQDRVFTAGDAAVADLQRARAGNPSSWSTYVAVANAGETGHRAARLGGRVIVPRIDAPAVGTVSVIADPGGALLGLFQPG